VQLQHPHLEEFSEVDMRVVEVTMGAHSPTAPRVRAR
jgi:hypothetical protein